MRENYARSSLPNFRLEQERRRQEELELQLQVQREMEERRLEELRNSEEQKEAARKEMERQRQQELEDNKRQELLARRQKESDEVLRLKGVNHGLGLELSQLVRPNLILVPLNPCPYKCLLKNGTVVILCCSG